VGAPHLSLPLIDLGTSPPSNAYVHADRLEQAEQWVPLKVAVCQQCWLVQTEDYTSADSLFDAEYAYFSSFSSTWLAHAERYVAEMVERFDLTPTVVWWKWPPTMATCCNTSPVAVSHAWASSRLAVPRRRRGKKAWRFVNCSSVATAPRS
jgi:hypothetical protein